MKNKNISILNISILIICLLILGWLSNDLYRNYSYERQFNGLYMNNINYTQLQAEEASKEFDAYGNWICINVKGMDYKQAIETCDHETGHEIFAEQCGKNISKCMEVVGK